MAYDNMMKKKKRMINNPTVGDNYTVGAGEGKSLISSEGAQSSSPDKKKKNKRVGIYSNQQ